MKVNLKNITKDKEYLIKPVYGCFCKYFNVYSHYHPNNTNNEMYISCFKQIY